MTVENQMQEEWEHVAFGHQAAAVTASDGLEFQQDPIVNRRPAYSDGT
jgi:hypothetical protein